MKLEGTPREPFSDEQLNQLMNLDAPSSGWRNAENMNGMQMAQPIETVPRGRGHADVDGVRFSAESERCSLLAVMARVF
jgi:uncharacterized protein YfaP (DUF2135 family)